MYRLARICSARRHVAPIFYRCGPSHPGIRCDSSMMSDEPLCITQICLTHISGKWNFSSDPSTLTTFHMYHVHPAIMSCNWQPRMCMHSQRRLNYQNWFETTRFCSNIHRLPHMNHFIPFCRTCFRSYTRYQTSNMRHTVAPHLLTP